MPASGTVSNDAFDEQPAAPIGHIALERNHSDEPIEVDVDSSWTLDRAPRTRQASGIDPLLARFGSLAIIVTIAAPLVVGFASSGSGTNDAEAVLATITSAPASELAAPSPAASQAPPTDGVAPAATADTHVDPAAATIPSSAPAQSATTEPANTEPVATEPASTNAAALAVPTTPVPATSEVTAAPVTTPPCGSRYDLAAGDYWIRIADEADVTLADLLAVNDSTVDTMLVPGRSICLPVGAATPSPPTTVAVTSPPTTSPVPTTAPSRPTATTVAPAPTTTVPARPAAVPTAQAEAIIRDVWPDDLEERALQIAWRESNYRSNVNNACCYGLFQIHFTAHRSWLATIGITSAAQLFDPVVNTNVAYTLYQRAGGFGPWGG